MSRGDLGIEKRSSLRKAVQYAVRFRSELLEFDSEAEWHGEVSDISTGGLFVRSDYFEPTGTPVSLLVWFPDRDEPVAMRGHVAWIAEHPPKGPGMGIKLAQSVDA